MQIELTGTVNELDDFLDLAATLGILKTYSQTYENIEKTKALVVAEIDMSGLRFLRREDPENENPGSLNPESLNPDSLNPGSLNPDSLNPGNLNPDADH